MSVTQRRSGACRLPVQTGVDVLQGFWVSRSLSPWVLGRLHPIHRVYLCFCVVFARVRCGLQQVPSLVLTVHYTYHMITRNCLCSLLITSVQRKESLYDT